MFCIVLNRSLCLQIVIHVCGRNDFNVCNQSSMLLISIDNPQCLWSCHFLKKTLVINLNRMPIGNINNLFKQMFYYLLLIFLLFLFLTEVFRSFSSLLLFSIYFINFLNNSFYISLHHFLNILCQRYHSEFCLTELNIARCYGHRKESFFHKYLHNIL